VFALFPTPPQFLSTPESIPKKKLTSKQPGLTRTLLSVILFKEKPFVGLRKGGRE
jgi:hypothetical protein